METTLTLLGLVALAIPVLLVVLAVKYFALSQKANSLAKETRRLSAQLSLVQTDLRDLSKVVYASQIATITQPGVAAPIPAAPIPVAPPEPAVTPQDMAPDAAPDLPTETIPDLPINLPQTPPHIAASTQTPAQADSAASPWQRAMPIPNTSIPNTPHQIAASPTASDSEPSAATPDQNRPLVLTAERLGKLATWLRDNWVYAVSALSLALAGVFFVQYGMEQGLLPPSVRVALGILFGVALIVAGEWMRRKHGDDIAANTAYLPSIFAGAGLVSIFAGILAARQLYGLIGPETAFAGIVVTATLALILGWFYGPLLAATGLLGAALAPFIVGGNGANTDWLYGYFTLIAATGLAVDAIRRWAWVSVLALTIGYGCGFLIFATGAAPSGWTLTVTILALLAATLPLLSIIPRHDGPSTIECLAQSKGLWPNFPTRLAAGAMLASTLGLIAMQRGTPIDNLLVYAALTLLATAFLLWARKARGLIDLALLPSFAFLARLALDAINHSPLAWAFGPEAAAMRTTEITPVSMITLPLALASLITVAAALRALGRSYTALFALAAALMAPLVAVMLELLWHPALVIGLYPWALHIMALAALMTGLALTFAKTDVTEKRRTAYATLSALSLIALALFVMTTQSALTLALATLVLTAAALDRRFKLPEMAWFIQLGCAVIGYRLTVNPGVNWALNATLPQVWIAYAGTIAALAAARFTLHPLNRPAAKAVLESAALGASALFANVLITRWLQASATSQDWTSSHWGVTLNALPWLILLLTQLYRLKLGGPMRHLRQAIAGFAALLSGGALALSAGPFNPLFAWGAEDASAITKGPLILDSLALAYALPGFMLLAAALKMPWLHSTLRRSLLAIGTALLTLYAGLEIRRFWQGDYLATSSLSQGELYTYTIAILLLGFAMLARLHIPSLFLPVRRRIAIASGAGAAVCLGIAILPRNPLLGGAWGTVQGPWLIDTLFAGYAVPALLLIVAALKLPNTPSTLRRSLLAIGTALLTLYAGLEIRRFWQGDYLGNPGTTQAELYSYTIALMLLGAGLLYQAIAKRSALLRRIAMGVIALTVAKVFLLDASGLTGLTRVFSFLGLGLSLAGLAWLNRWAADAANSEASSQK